MAKSSRKKSQEAQSETPESQDTAAQHDRSEAAPAPPGPEGDTAPEAIEDAEVVAETPPDSGSRDPADDRADSAGDDATAPPEEAMPEAAPVPPHVDPEDRDPSPDAPAPEDPTPDAVATDAPARDAPDPDDHPAADDPPPDRAAAEATRPTPPPAAAPEPPARRRGGVVPLLIGGLVAGGIGYGAETYLGSRQASGPDLAALIDDQSDRIDTQADRIDTQAERIDALGTEIDAIPPAPDLAPLQDRVDALEQQLTDRVATLEADLTRRIDALDARLTDVEKRPESDGTLDETAMAAYERELDALRADLSAQREEVTAIAEQAAEDLKAARAEAERLEQQAVQEARAAAGRAALNRLRVAVADGAPFADLLGDIEAVAGEVPQALAEAAETGVATRSTLEEEFAPAARAALAAAREEGVAGETGGLATFLRQQFDIRSTQPRAGDDPDAVLSRAEAAVEADRLDEALAELAKLPQVARAEMADWRARAQARAEALAAISDLSQSLNTN